MPNETLKKFVQLAETAGVIFIDHGPALTSWGLEKKPPVRFSASYVDETGVGYECELSGNEIADGEFLSGGFKCHDAAGYEVRMRFYRLKNMLEDA